MFSQARDTGEDYVWLGRVFFVWLSVFNLFVVSVFWSFMADIYTREQGRRLFGFITSGGSIGALIGGVITSALVTNIGFQNLLPMSAALLLFAVFCIGRLKDWVHHEHEDEIEETVETDKPLGGNPLRRHHAPVLIEVFPWHRAHVARRKPAWHRPVHVSRRTDRGRRFPTRTSASSSSPT